MAIFWTMRRSSGPVWWETITPRGGRYEWRLSCPAIGQTNTLYVDQLFINYLIQQKTAGQPFNQDEYDAMQLSNEQQWGFQTTPFPVFPSGDTLSIVSTIAAKYFPSAISY